MRNIGRRDKMAKFSRRHYIAIAGVIKDCEDSKIKYRLFDMFCYLFTEDNPLFDKERFREACYPEGKGGKR